MPNGYFALVLHAHLPFVRHPEDPTVMEEQWLYEAITGTYLPLLQTFEGLIADHVPFRCTVSLSAPLITMLTDDLLKVRYAAHLDKLIELAEKEIDRTRPERHYQRLAYMYADRFRSLRHTWRCHGGDLVKAFRHLEEAGRVEVITSTATHAFFPAMDRNWANIRAQIHVAADLFEKNFGHRPRGMWLGECGFVPGVDELLSEAAVRYIIVDTPGILFADNRPQYGLHASHCRGNREEQVHRLRGQMNRPPIVVRPYDAELYGHWWYEGPMFLGDVFRQMHFDQHDVETITPGDYLDRYDTNQVATPCAF